MMQAVSFPQFGGPEVLVRSEVSRPEPNPGQVRVKIYAFGVNYFDHELRGGLMPSLPLPHRLGMDSAGVIDAIGEGVNPERIGQAVVTLHSLHCGRCPACQSGWGNQCTHGEIVGVGRPGTYAEFVTVPESAAIRFSQLPFAQAAALPTTYATVWRLLVHRARIRPGQTLLVLGASGAVGSAAIQIAALSGLRVMAATGNREAAPQLTLMGAEAVIHYPTTDPCKAARDWLGGTGVDFVLDNGGGATISQSFAALKPGGAVLIVGGINGDVAEGIDLRSIWFHHWSLMGSSGATPEDLRAVVALAETGRVHPLITVLEGLNAVKTAHRMLESGKKVGKIIVTV